MTDYNFNRMCASTTSSIRQQMHNNKNDNSNSPGAQKQSYSIKSLCYEFGGFAYPFFLSPSGKKIAMFEVNLSAGESVDNIDSSKRSIFRIKKFPYDIKGDLYCDNDFFYCFKDVPIFTDRMISDCSDVVIGHIRRDTSYFPMNDDFILDLRDFNSEPHYQALYRFIKHMTKESKWVQPYEVISFVKSLNRDSNRRFFANTIILPDSFSPSSDN